MKCPTGIMRYLLYPSYLSMRALVAVLISKNCLLSYFNYLFYVIPFDSGRRFFSPGCFYYLFYTNPHNHTWELLSFTTHRFLLFETEAAAQQHPSSIYLVSFILDTFYTPEIQTLISKPGHFRTAPPQICKSGWASLGFSPVRSAVSSLHCIVCGMMC